MEDNLSMPVRSRDLIFFYSHENCPARATALPVLAWLAEKKGIDYEGYFCVRPSVADIGDAMPFTGNRHDQQFHYLANFYKHIYFFVLTEDPAVQFERFLSGRGDATIVKHASPDLPAFYTEVFGLLDEPLPSEAVVFSSAVFSFPNESIELGDFRIAGESRLDTFCFPEVFHRGALALHYELPDGAFAELVRKGLRKAYLLFCPEEARARLAGLGLEAWVVDSLRPGDNYTTLTSRIAERWLDRAKGLALGNDPITLRWTAKYLRERILPIAAVRSLPEAVEVLGRLTKTVGNPVVWGSQIFNDGIISDASRHDIILSLAHDVEVGMTIKSAIRLPSRWLEDAQAPWEAEYSDEYLIEQRARGMIPVCLLHYASDIGHLPVLPRYLDLHSIDGFLSGIAFPAAWWEYAEDQLEQLYLSKEMGGVFPSVEPLLSSAGTGVATEAKGYLSREAYLENLRRARRIIAERAGEKHVPIGHYSYQDACPRYKHGSAEPQYDVLAEAGFEYAVTYKDEGQLPHIVHAESGFTVINQQNEHWTFDPLPDLRRWEKRLTDENRPGWILLGLDSPFWGMVPCYFGLASKGLTLAAVQETMSYAVSGGESGRLFPAKPHEVVRFASLPE